MTTFASRTAPLRRTHVVPIHSEVTFAKTEAGIKVGHELGLNGSDTGLSDFASSEGRETGKESED